MHGAQRVAQDAEHRLATAGRLLKAAEQEGVSEEGRLAMTETALIVTHSAFLGVMKDYAERRSGMPLDSQMDTRRQLERLAKGSRPDTALQATISQLGALDDRRHAAYYMDEDRERRPEAIAEAVRQGIKDTAEAITIFPQRRTERTPNRGRRTERWQAESNEPRSGAENARRPPEGARAEAQGKKAQERDQQIGTPRSVEGMER